MADRDREAFDGFYDRMYRTDRVEQHQYAARESEDEDAWERQRRTDLGEAIQARASASRATLLSQIEKLQAEVEALKARPTAMQAQLDRAGAEGKLRAEIRAEFERKLKNATDNMATGRMQLEADFLKDREWYEARLNERYTQEEVDVLVEEAKNEVQRKHQDEFQKSKAELSESIHKELVRSLYTEKELQMHIADAKEPYKKALIQLNDQLSKIERKSALKHENLKGQLAALEAEKTEQANELIRLQNHHRAHEDHLTELLIDRKSVFEMQPKEKAMCDDEIVRAQRRVAMHESHVTARTIPREATSGVHPIAESRITRSSASDARDDGVTRHAKVMLKRYPGPNAHTVAEVNRSHVRGAHIAPVHLADESFKEYMESEEARELLNSTVRAVTRRGHAQIQALDQEHHGELQNDGRKRPRH